MTLLGLLFSLLVVCAGVYSASLRAHIPRRDNPSSLQRCWHIIAPVMWSVALVVIVIFIIENV